MTKAVDDAARRTKKVDALDRGGGELNRLKANVTDNLGIAKTLHSSHHDGRAVDAFTKAKEAFAALACDTRFTGIGDTDAFGGDQRGAIAACKAAFEAATAKEALRKALSSMGTNVGVAKTQATNYAAPALEPARTHAPPPPT